MAALETLPAHKACELFIAQSLSLHIHSSNAIASPCQAQFSTSCHRFDINETFFLLGWHTVVTLFHTGIMPEKQVSRTWQMN